MTVLFDTIALIGVGLIGSSIAAKARQEGLTNTVIGYSRRESTRQEISDLGLVDQVVDTLEAAVKDADLVILCSPVLTYASLCQQMAPFLKTGAIVTDVGSVKKQVLMDLQANLPDHAHVVPGHPIAGSEKSGPSAGFPDLFVNRWCILTPDESCDPKAVEAVSKFWRGCGANIDIMAADHHDQVLAITSHLPHLISYTIVGTADGLEASTKEEVIKYSAGGFRDMTRLAGSDPTMWRDIFLTNQEAVLEMLQRFTEDLTALQRSIRRGEGEVLMNHFTHTREIRNSIIDAGQAGTFDPREPEPDTRGEIVSPYQSN